uniref:Uncharacterized protein n=1 Tax=Meloidogyne javanica TaxID=6303 RepID=A0A915M1U7_MELJA
MSSSKTVSMLLATFVFVICSVGLLNLVESTTTRIIEVGRGKHKLEGDNVILSDGSRIAEEEDLKDYNFLSKRGSCHLEIDYDHIIVYFQKRAGCTVDLIVEDSDILNTNDTSHTAEFTIVLYSDGHLSDCLMNCSKLMKTNILGLGFSNNDLPGGTYKIEICRRENRLSVRSFLAANCAYSSFCVKHEIDISQKFIKLNFLMNTFPLLIEEKSTDCYPPFKTEKELVKVKTWKIINVGDNSDESLIGKRLIVLHLLPDYMLFPSCTKNGTINEEEMMRRPGCSFAIEFNKTSPPFHNETFTTTLKPENNLIITETTSTKTSLTPTEFKTLNKTKATIPVLIFPPEPNEREKDGIIDAIIMFAILILLISVAVGYYLIYLNKKDKPAAEDEFKSDLSINPVVIVAEDEGLDVDKTQEDEETSSDNENSEEVEINEEDDENIVVKV